ncbi:MAG: hypothetical protein N0C90_09175, partial [Candidatus Thiodiazotropha endolucinida]|nr:hypothetical protein [Candidatus Thiodiazotropha taylori]MCW4261528.1 hypothetical protein [Candidatus Thiodiazotropha endolucinida]
AEQWHELRKGLNDVLNRPIFCINFKQIFFQYLLSIYLSVLTFTDSCPKINYPPTTMLNGLKK